MWAGKATERNNELEGKHGSLSRQDRRDIQGAASHPELPSAHKEASLERLWSTAVQQRLKTSKYSQTVHERDTATQRRGPT